MFGERYGPTAVAVLVVLAAVAPVAATATENQGDAYAGAHVSFTTETDALVDYSVDGETVAESIQVESKRTAENGGAIDAGASLSAVTGIGGAAVSLQSSSETSATVRTESGATVESHDNEHGILVVRAEGEPQYVTVGLAADSSARTDGSNRVVVTTGNGTESALIVVGDGEVTVNEDGNVSASLGEDARLVQRTYPDGRDDADAAQEEFISDGTAVAEVYVMGEGESSVADTVNYSDDTAVEVVESGEGAVTLTAERAESEGRIVIASVSNAGMESTDDFEVSVDGEAAARASSYGELRSAIGGEQSKYLVSGGSNASADADVLVAISHFSKRTVEMQSTEGDGGAGDGDGDGSTNGTDEDTTESGGVPGFGPLVAFVGTSAATVFAVRRRR